MSQERLEKLQSLMRASNEDWPRKDFFTRSGKLVSWLEVRLAKSVGDSEIEFISSRVEGGRGASTTKYSATILTSDLVIFGELSATDSNQIPPYPVPGDVKIVHRSKITGLTLHHVEYFETDETPDYVSFTADFEDFPSLAIGMPKYSSQLDGSTARIFESLKADLAAAGQR
ncbi:hypothetical protein [Pseudarthrobacter oxydans]|uniref:hypothetical protein n=1 Tax=Pseudarthrobacter oxydans TaxID=1671 RepID=UPI00344A9478